MNFWRTIKEALESLSANKLRSALTILGIVIGVAAVVAMLAIGNGAEKTILGSIEGIGTNLIFVMPNRDAEVRNPKPLTTTDARAIADPFQAPSVLAVAPTLQSRVDVSYLGESKSTTLVGVTPNYALVRNIEMSEGEFINESDLVGRTPVVLLGSTVAHDLFGRSAGVVGETIRINGQPFRVAGLLVSKGGSNFTDSDDQVLVPLSTAQARLTLRGNIDEVDVIYAQALDAESVDQASQEISELLRARHRNLLGQDDFQLLTQQDFISTASTITSVLTIFLGGIAAISLLVGGIGIMNIMLVSVVERTREIGLRKALGARRRDILTQFLLESSLLSLAGGIIGILIGWALSFAVGQVAAASETPLNPAISLDSVLLATLFAAAVGLFFGLYPANRAAKLEPVEALRSE